MEKLLNLLQTLYKPILTDQVHYHFIARHQGTIVGYIIGLPLETLSKEPWARLDINFNKNNTIYTYAFVIQKNFMEMDMRKS